MEAARQAGTHVTPAGASFMDIPVSASPRCVCVGSSQLMYALRCFIRLTKMVCQLLFFFLSSIWFPLPFKTQDPRRSEAAWQKGSQVSGCILAEICWHISAKPFSFPATLLGGSNKQPASCFPLATVRLYPDPYGNTEGTYIHLRAGTTTLSGYRKGAFSGEKSLVSPEKPSSLLGAGWP